MSTQYDASLVPPPKDRRILVQIISAHGHCDLEWHEVFFDSSLDGGDLEIYDEHGKYVGSIWFWKEIENAVKSV